MQSAWCARPCRHTGPLTGGYSIRRFHLDLLFICFVYLHLTTDSFCFSKRFGNKSAVLFGKFRVSFELELSRSRQIHNLLRHCLGVSDRRFRLGRGVWRSQDSDVFQDVGRECPWSGQRLSGQMPDAGTELDEGTKRDFDCAHSLLSEVLFFRWHGSVNETRTSSKNDMSSKL